MIDKSHVYWGRHKDFKGFEKEAFRYGLGDGEARLDVSSKFKNGLQFLMRRMFFVFLLISFFLPLNLFLKVAILFLLSLSFRQYLFYVVTPWLDLKSKKYNFKVLLYSFFLFERTQLNYFKGYYKGYFSKNPKHKIGATLLAERLNKK